MSTRLLLCMLLGALNEMALAQPGPADDFIVEDDVLIKTRDGTPIAAVIVRSAEPSVRQPTALMYTIYPNDSAVDVARYAARWGYASVIAYTRGVNTGAVDIVPYEYAASDAYDVIDWISKQPWSDGQVGMYGGSYSGFVQWAVARLGHPALKTIVPQVSTAPGVGEPYENNVLVTQLAYLWPLANADYQQVPDTFYDDWYRLGSAYKDLDSIAQLENRTFNRWVEHPDFDGFWREIATDGEEFSRIDIPVLTTTGYYDDAQLGALYYFREHYRYKPDAEHYLAIGPYDHLGGQVRPALELRGYSIDPSANYLMGDLALEWLDYVLKGEDKPALIADRVNYQVMGADRWKHSPSLEAMHNANMRLYLDGAAMTLSRDLPGENAAVSQVIDFSDRDTQNNVFTPLIVNDEPAADNALIFVSEPLDREVEFSGNVTGEFVVTISKRDVDITYSLYEAMVDGRYFLINRYLGRASYAADRSERVLLTPGQRTAVPVLETKLTSRMLGAGSRLVLVLGVNRHPFEQINYGTGKNVSDESIADAGPPLEIRWHSASHLDIPVWID